MTAPRIRLYCPTIRAVGESFRPVVCWGEDSEPYRTGARPPKPTRLFAFTRRLFIDFPPAGHTGPVRRGGVAQLRRGRLRLVYKDGLAGSCTDSLDESKGVSKSNEVVLELDLGHGILYRPYKECVGPVSARALAAAARPLRPLSSEIRVAFNKDASDAKPVGQVVA